MFHFFDRTQYRELDNGFRIYGIFRPGVSTEVRVYVATGSMDEGKDLGCGLSHFVEHMLFQGCQGYPGTAVADAVNFLGGEANAFTGCDQTCFRMRMPREHWRDAVKMLAAMVRFPEFPAERFQKEKEVILRESESGMDNPGRRLLHTFLRTVFLRHPLRHPVIGYPDKIRSVTREMACDYHARRYTPGRSFAVLAGDFDFEQAVKALEESFGSWERGELGENLLPPEPFPNAGRSVEFLFPDSLSRLMAGIRMPEPGSHRYAALSLLFAMLASGDSSLLSTSLVLDKKLAHSVGSFSFPLGAEAVAGVVLEAEPGKMDRASSALKRELEKAAKGQFSAARMEREKIQQTADAIHECGDVGNIADILGNAVLYSGNPQAADRWIDTIRHLQLPDLRQAAAEFLDPSRLVQVCQRTASGSAKKSVPVPPLHVEASETSAGEPLIFVPDRTLPIASFSLLLPGGSLYEAPGQYGISRLCASLMTAGCRRYPEKRLLSQLDRCGADVAVQTGNNSMILHLSAPAKRMAAAVKITAEMLKEPLFGEAEFQREKERLLNALRSRAMDPFSAALNAGMKLLYGKHPYACRGWGEPEEIAALTAEDIRNFYFSRWYRSRLIYGFSGDLSTAEMQELAGVISGAVPAAENPCLPADAPVFPATLQRAAFSLPRSQTVVLRILPGVTGVSGATLNSFRILQAMENGLNSRLFREVREKYAFCYQVGMSSVFGLQRGNIRFYAMTAPEAAEKLFALLDEEIRRLADGKIGADEFEAAKRCAVQQFARGIDDPESLLEAAVLERHYGSDPTALHRQAEMTAAVTLQEFVAQIAPIFREPAGARVLVTPETAKK